MSPKQQVRIFLGPMSSTMSVTIMYQMANIHWPSSTAQAFLVRMNQGTTQFIDLLSNWLSKPN